MGIMGRHNGPSGLREDDDDDDTGVGLHFQVYL